MLPISLPPPVAVISGFCAADYLQDATIARKLDVIQMGAATRIPVAAGVATGTRKIRVISGFLTPSCHYSGRALGCFIRLAVGPVLHLGCDHLSSEFRA